MRLPLLLACGAALALPSSAHAAELAVLTKDQTPHARPASTSRALPRLDDRRPLTGQATTLPVLDSRPGWLEVRLPGRPNSSTGWIRASATRRAQTAWRIVVDVSDRRVRVYRDGRLARSVSAVVGAPATPTPTGSFFVEEAVRMPAGAAGGPVALALSARSDVYQEFEGGPGQVAIHGRDNLGGTLGQAQSHGCVRVSDPTWLTDRVPAGTPVQIQT